MLPELVAENPIGDIDSNSRLPGRHCQTRQLAVDGPVLGVVAAESIVPVCRLLKQEGGFDRLSAVTAVDWWPREPRFEVIYLLHSIQSSARLRLSVRVRGRRSTRLWYSVWRAANWYEREVFDLFGISFRESSRIWNAS